MPGRTKRLLATLPLTRRQVEYQPVQEVRWESWNYTFFYEEGNAYQLGTWFFVHNQIRSAVKRMEFISDHVSYIMLKGQWCDTIVVNLHALSEDKDDFIKYSFYEKIE